MAKKVKYHISGFDCPACAIKSERHLNSKDEIKQCSIDFTNERLIVEYENEELSIDEIKKIIKEVEADPIIVSPLENKKEIKSVYDKEFFFDLARIVVSFLTALFTKIFVPYETHFYLAVILYSVAALICLYDILYKVFRNIFKLNNPVDMNLLLSISSIGVIVLSSLIHYEILPEAPFEIDSFDGVLVVALYQVGELFEHIATNKSKRSIHAAINLRADKAHLFKDDKVIDVEPEELKVGDKIILNVGDIVPVDGIVISGKGALDTSSLTGESMLMDVEEKSEVLSGTILKDGSLILKVKNEYQNSTVAKIMELVESSGERKAKAEKFITKFARIYTPTVFVIGIIYALIYGFVTNTWSKAIFGGLAILVVSCPCAIVISVPLAFFAGVGLASKHGIIVKGTNYLDSLCGISRLYIDKTGTLTYGNFKVSDVVAVNGNKEELLEALYVGECRSNHPIAKAIIDKQDVAKYMDNIVTYEEFAGEGIKVHNLYDLVLVGNAAFLRKNNVEVEDVNTSGTVVYASKNGKYLGYVVLKDEIREDAKESIAKLKDLGVNVILLSGDKEMSVKEVAHEVGISSYHASLLPQDKTKYVESAVESKHKGLIAFAGDGINDTPSIIRADVGFAMGGIGSDVAVENADVVLMNDNPKKIYDSIRIAKKTRFVAIFNIVFSLLVKASVIVLILLGIFKQFGMIAAVLADTGLTVIMIINSLLVIYRKI